VNTNNLANHYSELTPEESFRLILAARDRGDEAELARLTNASPWITRSVLALAPYAHAFRDLLFMTYIELLEDAVTYLDANERANHKWELFFERMANERKGKRTKATARTAEKPAAENSETDPHKPAHWEQLLEVAYALGFRFKVKLAGWTLFCERWNASPFSMWEDAGFPGANRLRCAQALVETGNVFPTPADVVRWRNSVRPANDPVVTEADIITAELFADDLEADFREQVEWLGGAE
jgi:hypothetical protein